MAIYAISDLHLAKSIDKPMDIFGQNWSNYMERLKYNWEETVSESDVVIIPGDISWATYLEQAEEDFKFIEGLPGKKIISKGNHDYWWTTHSKLQQFLIKNGFKTIEFMQNNSYNFGNITICGTRGWICPGDDGFRGDDRKIYNREVQRLELSLKSAPVGDDIDIIVAMHYSPFNSKKESTDFVELMYKYKVKLCIYGHLHGEGFKNAVMGNNNGLEFKFISADYLEFKPIRII
ncbi:MAG: metallophosphoesterase [Bacillota bacterium]|nr:metallophosphoesterase [Bacillota bacterium]